MATWSGTVCTAFVVDTFSRRIVGWSAATNKRTPLILSALEMGLWRRDRAGNPVRVRELIHHSDAGSQYTSFRLGAHLAKEEIAASIGTVGDALDNALMESIIGLYKTEVIKPHGLGLEPLDPLGGRDLDVVGVRQGDDQEHLARDLVHVEPRGEGVSVADVGQGQGRLAGGVLEPVTGRAHRAARGPVPKVYGSTGRSALGRRATTSR